MSKSGAAAKFAAGKVIKRVVGIGCFPILLIGVLVLGLPLFLFAGMFGGSSTSSTECGGQSAKYAGRLFNANQLAIAQTIFDVGQTRKLSDRAIIMGLMAGLGESDLQNLDHGDQVRNDTIGVFQIGPEHGTHAQRMDPAWSAGNFYDRLLRVPNWETIFESHAIHKAQVNADPDHYAKHKPPATGLYRSILLGTVKTGAADPACGALVASGSTGTSGVKGWGGFTNGLIPSDVLCPIPWLAGQRMGDGTGYYARCDAVKAMTALNTEFKTAFGEDIQIFSSYRSQAYQAQLCVNAKHACAAPGTSVHGLGLAIDFASGIDEDTTPQHKWMIANAGRYGIVHPAWATKPGKGFEPWHWEFNPDQGIQHGVVTVGDVAAASDADPMTR